MHYTPTRNVESDAQGVHLGRRTWSSEKVLATVVVWKRRPRSFNQQKGAVHKMLLGNNPNPDIQQYLRM